MDNLKEIAKKFITSVINDDVTNTYDQYTTSDFTHHNPFFKKDRATLLAGMIESNKIAPDKQLTIQMTIAEGQYVSLFCEVKINDALVNIAHVYRFEGEKIAEMWDISQQIPKDSPNEYYA